jgi:hypothetical protein
MTKIFYVYADYTKEKEPHIFYIGKGIEARLKKLNRPTKNTKNKLSKHDAIIKKYGIERKILFQTENEKEAFNKEIELIAFYKLNMYKHPENHYACNHTDGGEGSSGKRTSISTKKKLRNIKLGKNTISNNGIEKLKQIHYGNKNPMYKKFGELNPNSKYSNEVLEYIVFLRKSGMKFKLISEEIYYKYNIIISKEVCNATFNRIKYRFN